MKSLNYTLASFKESIFSTMSKKAVKNQAINLSQGFPDFPPPAWLLELQLKYSNNSLYQQYAPSIGIAELRQNIAKNYISFYDLSYCPDKEITIVNGATEAIFVALKAILNPQDEVILFEPYYDSYRASVELAGATAKFATLHAPDFKFNISEVENLITPNTKCLILNSPHNPTGRVFSQQELQDLAELVKKHDLYVISDEVYEHLTFDGNKHIPFAKISGMLNRTITISSAGKTFGATGLKVGWVSAPVDLSAAIRLVHQFNTFSVHHSSQKVMADALEKLPEYLPEYKSLYQRKRDYFVEELSKLGFGCHPPQGTYFILANIQRMTLLKDIGFCLELIERKKVATIPPSAFYENSSDGEKYLRFCFAKKDATLEAAIANLKN